MRTGLKGRSGRRWLSAALAALVTAAGLGYYFTRLPEASAHPGPPSSVFDRAEVRWSSLRDYLPANLATELAERSTYIPVDVEADFADSAAGKRLLGAVLQENTDGRASRVEMRMTPAQYNTARASATAAGLRLIDFEPYTTTGTNRLIAAAWVQDREGLRTVDRYDLTSDQAQALYEEKRATHMPVDIDAYLTTNGLRFASIWVRNTEGLRWTLRRSVTSQQFIDQTNTLGSGYRMLGFDSYLAGSQMYSGIWVENRNGRRSIFHRDMGVKDYENRWFRLRDEGYRLIGYERYETDTGTRYAGIWRQNSDQPDWPLKTTVSDRIAAEVENFDVPGMSVAIMQQGEVKFLRGYGYANLRDRTWMDSAHIMRLASVSKAVAGVLTMRLAKTGDIALGSQTRSYVTGLPAHHRHDIEELASNRGCVGHYQDTPEDIDDDLESTPYATARAAARRFWSEPLVPNCTIGSTNYYSTHGYTILGAAMEGAMGRPVADLVRGEITERLDLPTLRPEDLNANTRRAKLYDTDNDEAAADQTSWKLLGGGLESNAYDLARFGDLLMRDQIIPQAYQDQMWTSTRWPYAYGWEIRTVGGRLEVRKDGAQRGANSAILLYPNDGIVISVLSNRKEGGHNAETLALALGKMITDALP